MVEFADANEPQLIAYGEPSDKALRLLHDKARSLGRENVIVHALHAGFSRFEAS